MSDIKLGVQLFTLRDKCKNAEDFETTLKFLDSIGCNVIQISAIGDIHPEKVAELVDKYKMDVLGLYIGILFVVIGIGIPAIKYRETLSILETIRLFGFWILIPIILVVVGVLQIVKCLKNGK